jgi:hypothetical protein
MPYRHLAVTIVYLLNAFQTVASAIPQSELAVLIDFVSAFPILQTNYGWNISADPCDSTWQGVTCSSNTNVQAQVTVITDLTIN